MSFETAAETQSTRLPESAARSRTSEFAGVANDALDIVWHSSQGERGWVTYLFSEVKNARHTTISEWRPSNGVPSIHVVSTNDKETKARIPNFFIDLHKRNIPFAIFHMSDEWFREDTSFYKYGRFCLRNYWCSFISNHDLFYVPLGYPSHCSYDPAAMVPASKRKYLGSFTGQMKYSRVQMLKTFEGMERFYYPKNFITDAEYIALMGQTTFAPCPMGNTTPDTWRFYESMEAGAIPIIERRATLDYFRNLFGEHPIPTFRSWPAARAWVEGIKSPAALDEKQAQVQQWWRELKAKWQGHLAAIVREKFDPKYKSALEDYKPAYSGLPLKLRWRLELMRHLNVGSIPLRILNNTGLRRVRKKAPDKPQV